MCNLGVALGFLIAAEITFGVSVSLVITAAALATNMFTNGGSVGLLLGALAALALCLTTLGAAMANFSSCGSASGCGLFASRAWNLSLGAIGTLSGFALTIGLIIPTVVVPILGTVVAVTMVVVMLGSATLFFAIIDQLRRFEACRGTTNSAASDIALGIAVLNFLGVLVAVGVMGAKATGEATCVGPNC